MLPRRAILKTVPDALAWVKPLRVAVMREACILEALQHAGIVRLFETGLLRRRPPVVRVRGRRRHRALRPPPPARARRARRARPRRRRHPRARAPPRHHPRRPPPRSHRPDRSRVPDRDRRLEHRAPARRAAPRSRACRGPTRAATSHPSSRTAIRSTIAPTSTRSARSRSARCPPARRRSVGAARSDDRGRPLGSPGGLRGPPRARDDPGRAAAPALDAAVRRGRALR